MPDLNPLQSTTFEAASQSLVESKQNHFPQISLAKEQEEKKLDSQPVKIQESVLPDLWDLEENEAKSLIAKEQQSTNGASKVLSRLLPQVLFKQDGHDEQIHPKIQLISLTKEEQNKVNRLNQESSIELKVQNRQTLNKTSQEIPQKSDFQAEINVNYQEQYRNLKLAQGDVCPHCKQGLLVLKHTIKADLLSCTNTPKCGFHYFVAKNHQVQTVKELSSTCPQCGKAMAIKKGKFGLFIGCSNYPECDYIFKEQDEQDITCPICHKGQLQSRRTKNGRTFYGCNHYPECDFILTGAPYLRTCPECGFPVAFKKKVKAGTALICANSLCKSRRRRKQFILEANA